MILTFFKENENHAHIKKHQLVIN